MITLVVYWEFSMKERGKKTLALVPLNLDGYLFKDQWARSKAQQVRYLAPIR
jgi:hypothetical protein